MIRLKRDLIKTWLEVIGHNQTWLAKEMGFSKGFVSQMLSENCDYRVPDTFKERFKAVSHMEFDRFLYTDHQFERRKYYWDMGTHDARKVKINQFYENSV